ncbi:MAG TPA: transporter [Desulfobacteraceae bacterium]|nr:transporter [Desulfobacteraceae bacterium]|tara:strand:- start:246 stop:1160 length:915 start_codon:yes stop_codon:yes gene_type:complete
MIVLDTLFPLFFMLMTGAVLKQKGWTSDSFLKTCDRLVYFIFFPVMLFWKVGTSVSSGESSTGLCLAGFLAVGAVFLLSLAYIRKGGVTGFEAGSFSQASYRFNTYIGMAVVVAVLGEEGIRHFGILIGFLIPAINVMAVSVLIWYAGHDLDRGQKLRFFVKALVSNPLILGCAGGILVSRSGIGFPAFLNNTFALISSVTLPLALISIGGTLSFSGVARKAKPSLAAAGFKLLVLPVMGFLMLKLFGVTGVPFKTGMIFFSLPTSTALYVLSAQLNSDLELAATAIMTSTMLSFVSLSVALLL